MWIIIPIVFALGESAINQAVATARAHATRQQGVEMDFRPLFTD
jgi:stage V sporulation protein SpoVS